MQSVPGDSDAYGGGCCALGVFFLFVPMFIGILYSFGLFRSRESNPDDNDRPQGA